MRYRLLALVAVLGGCDLGLEPPEFPFTYTGRCLNLLSVVELNEPDIAYYEDRAETILDERFGAGTFCRVSASIPPVQVMDTNYLPCGIDEKCMGTTNTADLQITLTRHGFALLHEYIHAHELSIGKLDTVWHWGWNASGYRDMDREFWEPFNTRLTWVKTE